MEKIYELNSLLDSMSVFSKKEEKPLENGYNIFEVISDQYYKENFHSDIIFSLLSQDFNSESELFLNLFIQFLNSSGKKKISLDDFKNPLVTKEKDRVDVRIRGKNKTVIIENKINNAVDQYRQLPKYLDKEKKSGFEVVSIVYLRLNCLKEPDKTDWTESEIDEIDSKLIKVDVFDTANNLIDGWLIPCLECSKNNRMSVILEQYIEIIKKLKINEIAMEDLEKFYDLVIKNNNKFESAETVKEILLDLPKYRASRIKDKLQQYDHGFRKANVFTYSGVYRAKLENHKDAINDFNIDIECYPDKTRINIGGNQDVNKSSLESYLATKNIKGDLKQYKDDWLYKYYIDFNFPSEESNLYNFIDQLLS